MTIQLPFSKTRKVGNLVFLSGEVPFADDGSIPAGITEQTNLTMKRIAATLATEGLTLNDVVSVTVFLTDKAYFAEFNEAYKQHFAHPYPVRTTVCSGLMIDALVEITVVAESKH